MAERRWREALDGSWWVERDGDAWTYRAEGVPGEAVRVVARVPDAGAITSWLVV